MKLQGKTAVITGASSGIGKATALMLAREGAQVVLAARREQRLKDLADQIHSQTPGRALAIATDVTDRNSVKEMVQQAETAFGDVNILINNAGVMLLSFIKNNNVKEWEQMVDVNIKGVLFGIHAVLPGMMKQGAGHIINVSSVSGHEVSPASSVYSATKYAVRALSMGLEKELSRLGIRITNLSPGAVATELTDHITDEEVRKLFAKSPIKALESQDIADAIHYVLTQPDHVNVNEVIVRPTNKKN